MLCGLSQEQLARTLMPLGPYSKEQVRRIAQEAGLPVAAKADSQEICFVADDDYARFIRDYLAAQPGGDQTALKPAGPFAEGNFVSLDGKVLGRHKGIANYTVGQRKGLGIALGAPAYVIRIDAAANEVVLGTDADLWTREVLVKDVNFMGIAGLTPGEELHAKAKIRYQHAAADCTIALEENTLRLTFDQPVRAAAPGQAAVVYDEQGCVLCGGTIAK